MNLRILFFVLVAAFAGPALAQVQAQTRLSLEQERETVNTAEMRDVQQSLTQLKQKAAEKEQSLAQLRKETADKVRQSMYRMQSPAAQTSRAAAEIIDHPRCKLFKDQLAALGRASRFDANVVLGIISIRQQAVYAGCAARPGGGAFSGR